ncbi:AfsR/SARP family transcriptional regulator [Actinophytocola algeriensis]|uniref:Putative ATPase/DNA-binding SARP family transcriptional activator n=1 Tax=Actinophytocola algeriensis TaxID=1768010 RepID=A0A7W7VFV0_9PSEU|nr:BTAD domain-containing putative transcriptional regulator [Actinophytocola algeriensis]MBB4908474.1 putative ATPase/DNA-binding SARP family transcriptional activator [Actinophytocola algeriensis]MBE1475139.1 putative ATPase/DNA-binding SARP family transcriptional activator [Actinophytocola algeriensis]
MDTACSVDLRLLGPLEATGPGGALRLSGGRQRALLALLALRAPAVVSRAQLVDALWGTAPPPTAVKTLHSHLARVRQAMVPAGLGSLLVTAGPGYALRLPPGTLDIDRFAEHLRAGRLALGAGDAAGAAARLRAGVALWRGDPLADCPVAEWGLAEVDRLREAGIGAAEALAEADLARGEHAAAVDDLERLLTRHPLRERPWELLMIAHHRAGRQAEALRTYRRARAVLVAELGVEPGAELRRLEAAVLAGAAEVDPVTAPPRPAPVVTAPVAAMAEAPGLVGRHRELADVRRLLDRARLVTLTGPGGCGKTRLATSAVTAFPAPVVIDLTPVTDPGLVADAVATALGAPERPDLGRVDTVVEALSGERLVVLDNCEHLVRACAELVVRLLAACPGLTVLATSREALRVADEVTYEVPPLAVPDPDVPRTLPELAVYDAVRLFLDRAAEQGVRDFGDDDAAAIARLCAALDGLPLAIELAAARTPVLTPAQIVRRLRDRFGLLTYGVAGPAHHRTLRATLAWSHDSLTAAEATLFGRLAVFAGGFTVDAAEAVGGTLDALTGLVAKSLVRRQGGTGRFTMLETIAAYAAEQLPADDPAHRGHAEYFLALAEEADAEPAGDRLRELRADHDNLRTAMAWFASRPDPAGELRLAAALCRYCHLHGHYREGRQWLARALSRTGDDPALAKALAGAASLALFECDYAQAAAHATAGLAHAAGDHRLVGRLQRLLGSVAREQARYPEALRWYTASRESFRAAADLFGVAYSHQLAGATAWLAGDLDSAGAHLMVSLTRLRELDDSKGAASSLAYLGAVAHHRGDDGTARRLLEEALDTFGQLEFKEGIAWALNLLGLSEHAEGRPARAAELLCTSLAHHRELGDRWRQASVLEALAAVACSTGEPDRAALLLHQAEAIRTAIDAPVPLVERAALAATYEAVGVERDTVQENDGELVSGASRAVSPG